MKMTFNKWLKTQEYREDPTGDIAQDSRRDRRLKPGNTLPAWQWHLRTIGACKEALEALEQAWKEYEVDTMEE